MSDIILVLVIVAFFVGAALLVRVLDRMIADSGPDTDTDPGDEAPGEP
jgi:H+/Cl- antiporter ClcA